MIRLGALCKYSSSPCSSPCSGRPGQDGDGDHDDDDDCLQGVRCAIIESVSLSPSNLDVVLERTRDTSPEVSQQSHQQEQQPCSI
jgi:hypothetical protein